MAQIINSYNTIGLFVADTVAMTSLTQDSFNTDLVGGRDAVIALIELPSGVSGNFSLECLPADEKLGDKSISVALTEKALNVVRLTTKGIKKPDGTGDFKIVEAGGAAVASMGIKVCIIKSLDVINH